MLPGRQSYKLIRTDLTLQGYASIFCVDEAANIAQYFALFYKKVLIFREGTIYKIRKEGSYTKLSSNSLSRQSAASRK